MATGETFHNRNCQHTGDLEQNFSKIANGRGFRQGRERGPRVLTVDWYMTPVTDL